MFEPHAHVYRPERPGTVTHERPDAHELPHAPQWLRPESATHDPEQHAPPLHEAPFARSACVQPDAALQPSVVHALLSSQLRTVPMQ